MRPAEQYPEHQKLKATGLERDHVQGFLDWLLDETPLTLAAWDAERPLARRLYGKDNGRLVLAESLDVPTERIEDFEGDGLRGALREALLAGYFGIDPRKIADEKDQMLAEIRAKQ